MSLRASPTFVLPILLSLSGCGDSASPVVQEYPSRRVRTLRCLWRRPSISGPMNRRQ
jgi:hypothetical protein